MKTKPKQTDNKPTVRAVRLDALITDPDTFQFRETEQTEYHVDDLEAELRRGGTLDPMVVWVRPEDGKFVVVDGHHRLAAYRKYGADTNVKVVVHECDLKAARLLALGENRKARLPMTATEKANAAWRLELAEQGYSKAEIVRATGISDGTVGQMRRVKGKLEEDRIPLPDTWWKALQLVKGRGGDDDDADEAMREAIIEARAAKLDKEIGKAIAAMTRIQPEAVERVLYRRLGRRGREYMLEEWGDVPDDYGF